MKNQIIAGVISALLASLVTFIVIKIDASYEKYELKSIAQKIAKNPVFVDLLIEEFSTDKRFKGKNGIDLAIGTIIISYGSSEQSEKIGDHFLLCNGQEIKKDAYPELFAHLVKINPESQISNGRAKVPNLVDKFIMGSNLESTGDSAGESTVTLGVKHIPEHIHTVGGTVNWEKKAGSIGDGNLSSWVYVKSSKTNIDINRKPEPHNNIPPYVKANFYIKAK
ncbi:tail fiber protein [Neptunomonas sp.]|uniref:tail fiber protein n=1 Tax=Neptunomonas sp. TaxID=1971898 RepID=UPI0025CE499D|nr:tail fiber protein [Neptunomonas sp.]